MACTVNLELCAEMGYGEFKGPTEKIDCLVGPPNVAASDFGQGPASSIGVCLAMSGLLG